MHKGDKYHITVKQSYACIFYRFNKEYQPLCVFRRSCVSDGVSFSSLLPEILHVSIFLREEFRNQVCQSINSLKKIAELEPP